MNSISGVLRSITPPRGKVTDAKHIPQPKRHRSDGGLNRRGSVDSKACFNQLPMPLIQHTASFLHPNEIANLNPCNKKTSELTKDKTSIGFIANQIKDAKTNIKTIFDMCQNDAQRKYVVALYLGKANLITDPFWKSATLKEIAEAQVGIAKVQAQGGNITGAMTTANLITDPSWKSSALREIAQAQVGITQAQVQRGDIDRATRTIQEALNTANLITPPRYKTSALKEIAKAQAQGGDIPGAASTIQEALNTANLITNSYLKSLALREIAEAKSALGIQ